MTGEVTRVAATLGEIETQERRRGRLRLYFNGPLRIRRTAERETLILALINALDMYTTVYWVAMGHAVEANPLLAPTFQTHPLAFVLTKSLFCLPALYLAPRLAQSHPRFTVVLLRAIIAAYVGIYLMAVR